MGGKKKSSRLAPDYLRSGYQLTATVLFTALFSIVFLLVSIPFSHNAWFQLGNSVFFLFTVLFALGALAIVIFSKWVLYKTRNILRMTLFGYVMYNVGEIIVICLLYTIFTVSITPLTWADFFPTFLNSLVYGTISLAIPYTIAGMYFSIIDKNNIIRMLNYSEVVSDEVVTPGRDERMTLYDNNGVMKLSVSSSNLYYVEADDNYIKVWYSDSSGELKIYMLRCRLKTVEESFCGTSLVRCHRRYVVNMDKVKVLKKEKDGYELELENDSIPPITVTKTYAANVLDYFNSTH